MSTTDPKRDRRIRAAVFTSVQWGTKQTRGYANFVQSPGLTGPSTSTYSRIQIHKERPVTGSATKDEYGFRKPTGFRAYVVSQVNDSSYDYEAGPTLGSKATRYWGSASGLPQSDTIYDACFGAGNFPRVGTNQRNRATTEALNKIKDSNLSFGEDIAELGDTVSMLVDALTRAAKALHYIRQKRWADAANALVGGTTKDYRPKRKGVKTQTTAMDRARHRRTAELRKAIAQDMVKRRRGSAADILSSHWLEYQYGWRPLISTISELSLLAHKLATNAVLPILNVKHTVVDNDDLPGKPNTNYSVWSVKGSMRNICFVRLDYRVTDDVLATLDSLGLANPLALAWNLVPLSFVVDWLIPIGNAIQGLSANWGIEYVAGSRTETTLAELQYTYVSQTGYRRGIPKQCGLKSLTTQRIVLPSLPLPRLYVKSPITLTRFATTLALLHQLRR